MRRSKPVQTLLGIPSWQDKSTRTIAEHVGVHHTTVVKIKNELVEITTSPDKKVKGKDGKRYPAVQTLQGIPSWHDKASRTIAEHVGVSKHLVQTIRDELAPGASSADGKVESKDGKRRSAKVKRNAWC